MKALRRICAGLALAAIVIGSARGAPPGNRVTCSLFGNILDFGQGPFAQLRQAARTQSTIRVDCGQGTLFQVGISNGSNGLVGDRRMRRRGGSQFLSYELYRSLNGSDRFGDALLRERVIGISFGPPVSIPVYGQIVGEDPGMAGDYFDDAVVTLYF